jgi:hypothetical protein
MISIFLLQDCNSKAITPRPLAFLLVIFIFHKYTTFNMGIFTLILKKIIIRKYKVHTLLNWTV